MDWNTFKGSFHVCYEGIFSNSPSVRPSRQVHRLYSRYLLTSQQRPHSVNDIMPMIGARFYTHLDSALLRADVIENELAKVSDIKRDDVILLFRELYFKCYLIWSKEVKLL